MDPIFAGVTIGSFLTRNHTCDFIATFYIKITCTSWDGESEINDGTLAIEDITDDIRSIRLHNRTHQTHKLVHMKNGTPTFVWIEFYSANLDNLGGYYVTVADYNKLREHVMTLRKSGYDYIDCTHTLANLHESMQDRDIKVAIGKAMRSTGGAKSTSRNSKQHTHWLPTSRTVTHKGKQRKVWRDSNDASVLAVKRLVQSAAGGKRKYRFETI